MHSQSHFFFCQLSFLRLAAVTVLLLGKDYVFVFVYYSKMVFVYKICCSAVCNLLYVSHVKTHIDCVLCDCSS